MFWLSFGRAQDTTRTQSPPLREAWRCPFLLLEFAHRPPDADIPHRPPPIHAWRLLPSVQLGPSPTSQRIGSTHLRLTLICRVHARGNGVEPGKPRRPWVVLGFGGPHNTKIQALPNISQLSDSCRNPPLSLRRRFAGGVGWISKVELENHKKVYAC